MKFLRIPFFIEHLWWLLSFFYSFTQGSTSFMKLGLRSGFDHLESSIASHSITTFQIKKRKKLTKDLFLGYILGGTTTCSQRNFSGHKESCKYCIWCFDQFLEMTLLRLNSNGVTLNLKNCLFSIDSLQWFFSKEGNKPDRSKLEETEKTHTPKNAKKWRSF